MAKTSRQTAIFGTEDWKRLYKTYKEADFQSYNFETLRKTFIDYLRQHHPETFNDFIESSEYIALLNVIAFMGQSLAFRNDLNTRENFLDTAQRRDSVNNLTSLISYVAKRNEAASGYLKVTGISTTEHVIDYNKNDLSNITIRWNDKTNDDWQEQFTAILNAALIDSQKIGQPGHSAEIVGVKTDEYELSVVPGFLPIVPFEATVDGIAMDFEIVNGTSVGKNNIFEPAPRDNGPLNILYRNDGQGFASSNTGYFFYFKQGTLRNEDFSFVEKIANRSIELDTVGVNNTDVWLFNITSGRFEEWSKVENIYAANNTQLDIEERKFFSVSSRNNDQVTLNFGDGVFSTIPVGDFRAYLRESNGLEYVINPEEIQNINVALPYISREGRTETITFTLSLTQPVSNAKASEDIEEIKRRAPPRFYTQNRMANGEDYNNFPYASYSSIIKSKAINRTNIGASRYLDLVDPTGRYSSINTYGSDGLIYKDSNEKSFRFTFNDKNDIVLVIKNQVEPLLAARSTIQYYYDKFSRIDLSNLDLSWVQNTVITNKTTGWFSDSAGNAKAIGPYVNDNRQYLIPGALVKFVAPPGTHFNENNKLVAGTSLSAGDKLEIWATIIDVENEGTKNGSIATEPPGTKGPVEINNFVPTGAIPVEIIPLFNSDLPVSIEQEMLEQIELSRDFGIGYDHLTNEWYLITSNNLDINGEFSLDNARSMSSTNEDSSWLVKFISTPSGYIVTGRALHYYFASILETRFFFDENQKIFDPKTGKVINDFIRILKTNSKPDGSNEPLSQDIIVDIIGQTVESDGFVNDYHVEISFVDSDNDGIADDPDYFEKLVDETGIGSSKTVYFQRTVDFDNLERYLPIPSDTIIDDYATEGDIAIIKTEFLIGQIFYAYEDKKFFELVYENDNRNLVERDDFIAKIGRDKLHFQYKHNSPETRRINPSVTNIIDIYVVTSSYYDAYIRYIRDNTGTIKEPEAPTTDQLQVQYEELQNKKMVSDNIVLSSVKFKPLFGKKAEESLQAYIRVVRPNNSVASDSEIKSRIISEINNYFDIENWDFGDTFYFSELSAYLHSKLGDLVGSIIIVPKDPTKVFGDLYEIKSAPYEIFVSAATVDDIDIIDSLTSENIQAKVE